MGFAGRESFSEFFSWGELEKRREKEGGGGIFDSVLKLDSAFSDDVGGGRFQKEILDQSLQN